MDYRPASLGPHPVGVRSETILDATRQRKLDCTIYYAADPSHTADYRDPKNHDRYCVLPAMAVESRQAALRDAAPANVSSPLIVFSHGFASDRRQSSFLCIHLASHGYRVLCPSHPGNTIEDAARLFLPTATNNDQRPAATLAEIMAERPLDLRFVLDALGDRERHETKVGALGHSFGGWTCFAAAQLDSRIRSIVALAPAGGRNQRRSNPMADALGLPPANQAPTLILAAAQDTVLPLNGVRELYRRCSQPKTLAILDNADHMHFCDRAAQLHEFVRNSEAMQNFLRIKSVVPPFSDLCTEEAAHTVCKALALSHFDATLRNHEKAKGWLRRRGQRWLKEAGIGLALEQQDPAE
jgi:predicted dienelactone hydrolase